MLPIPAALLTEGEAMSKPTHIAYVVTELTEAEKARGDKSIWHAIGAVWPHGKGGGFDVVIHDQLSVSGRIVCTERKEKPAEDKAPA
jgi:hypothetical protein